MRTLEDLQAERAARLDRLDLPGTMTQREMDDYEAATARLDRYIFMAREALSALAENAPRDEDIAWRDFLIATRPKLCAELEALPPRDKRQQNLQLSILAMDKMRGLGVLDGTGYSLNTLRLGAYLRESGYTPLPPVDPEIFGRMPWFGSLPEVERRIADVEKRRVAAEAALNEALLDDAERDRLNASRAAEVARKNALPQRKFRGDGSQYDKWPDGRIEEVAAG